MYNLQHPLCLFVASTYNYSDFHFHNKCAIKKLQLHTHTNIYIHMYVCSCSKKVHHWPHFSLQLFICCIDACHSTQRTPFLIFFFVYPFLWIYLFFVSLFSLLSTFVNANFFALPRVRWQLYSAATVKATVIARQ